MVFETHSVGSGCRREARQRLRVIQAYDEEIGKGIQEILN